jgi:transcriptional regulator with XRE-family HTH domain
MIITEMRAELRLPLAHLAREAGVSRQLLTYVEHGLTPSKATTERIAEALAEYAEPEDREHTKALIRAAITKEQIQHEQAA